MGHYNGEVGSYGSRPTQETTFPDVGDPILARLAFNFFLGTGKGDAEVSLAMAKTLDDFVAQRIAEALTLGIQQEI